MLEVSGVTTGADSLAGGLAPAETGGTGGQAAFGGVPELIWVKAIPTPAAAYNASDNHPEECPPSPPMSHKAILPTSTQPRLLRPSRRRAPPTQRLCSPRRCSVINRRPRGTAGSSRCGRASGATEGRVMIGWLRRSRDAGGSLMSSPARPVARRGAGSVAAAAMALGFLLWPTASGAGIAEAGHPQGGGHGDRWSGPVSPGTRSTRRWPGRTPQPFHRIRWRAKVDLSDLSGGVLPIHYGSPMITAANAVWSRPVSATRPGSGWSRTPGRRRAALVARHRLSAACVHGRFRHLDASVARRADARARPWQLRVQRDILVRRHANLAAGSVRRRLF